MNAIAPRRRGIVGLSIFTTLTVALLLALGVWQLQRGAEKHALIAALSERLTAAPTDLPPTSQWSVLTPAKDEFRRVRFSATYQNLPDAMVYSSGSAIRDDIAGPGAWAFVPALLPEGGIVVINTGFVQNTMQDRVQQDRAVALLITGTAATLTGYIRFPESGGLLTPSANKAKRLWFVRDLRSMAQMLGWTDGGKQVAPFYIDLESPAPASGVPKPGPLSVHLKDDHLQYAITWFGLAAVVMAAFMVWLRGRRRA